MTANVVVVKDKILFPCRAYRAGIHVEYECGHCQEERIASERHGYIEYCPYCPGCGAEVTASSSPLEIGPIYQIAWTDPMDGATPIVEKVPNDADHIRLRALGVKW